MSDNPKDQTPEVKALIARLSRQMPLRAQRELNVCVEMDLFEAAWAAFHGAMEAVQARPAEMSPYASPAALQAAWRDSLVELQTSFGRTGQHAQALTKAIKIMLALE